MCLSVISAVSAHPRPPSVRVTIWLHGTGAEIETSPSHLCIMPVNTKQACVGIVAGLESGPAHALPPRLSLGDPRWHSSGPEDKCNSQ
ncbi:hypothetical protein J6590_030059 [Homalodisca vitripennis]|nr:hypothetical protein J6590_030059 [Homalodisca vitripennis]